MFNKKDTLPYLASIGYSIIFGLSFLFSKMALEVASPFKLISFRFLLAFLTMSVLILFKVIKVNYKGKKLKELLILSLLQPVVYFIFETYGIKYSSSSYAGVLIALIPVLVSIIGIYFLNEVPSKSQWFFILLSVSGVIYIVLNDNNSGSSNTLLGTVCLLIAIVAGSIYNILSRKSSTNFSSMEITYFMMGTAAIVFNIIALVLDIINGNMGDFFKPLSNSNFIISLLFLGILSSIVAFFLANYALSKLPASRSTVFGNLSTVISIFTGVFFLNENFYFYHVIGSLMILSGIIGTNYFNAKPKENLEIKESNNYATNQG
ncbi:DMT family transporter [Clostridium malenominatum]|uniref:DMT family transporter n=1 Tax=Clostridium malenominatum TaxID=1539 RepID=A0ABP3TTI2_9CLOT